LEDYEEYLETPRKRKIFWTVYKKTSEKKSNTERLLRQKNHRFQAKIRTLSIYIDYKPITKLQLIIVPIF